MRTARFLILAAALALELGAASAARAFGQEGHSIVAEIAQRRLAPAATAQVAVLLGPGASLASAASWADDIREARPQTANWHFVNLPLASDAYDPARDCAPSPRGDCILAALERARATLADAAAPKPARTEALMWVVHLVADLHQPLHTVTEDRGGNTFPVRFFTDPTGRLVADTNLHRLWDSGLVGYRHWNWGAWVDRLERDWLPGADRAALEAGTPVDWMRESHVYARTTAVAGISKGDTLGADYAGRVMPGLDRQLGAAGLRLARLLNTALAAPGG